MCGESITAVHGGCVGSAGFAEVLCTTYSGQILHFTGSSKTTDISLGCQPCETKNREILWSKNREK